MKNGSKNKSVAFIFLFSVYVSMYKGPRFKGPKCILSLC